MQALPRRHRSRVAGPPGTRAFQAPCGSSPLVSGTSQLVFGSGPLVVGSSPPVSRSSRLVLGASRLVSGSSRLVLESGPLVSGSRRLALESSRPVSGSGWRVFGRSAPQDANTSMRCRRRPGGLGRVRFYGLNQKSPAHAGLFRWQDAQAAWLSTWLSSDQFGGSGQSASWLPASTRCRSRWSICGASVCSSSMV